MSTSNRDGIADSVAQAAITELVAAYGRSIDDRDAEAYERLWTGDVRCQLVPSGTQLEGRSAMLRGLATLIREHQMTRHAVSRLNIEVTSVTTATGHCEALVLAVRKDESVRCNEVAYDDTYVYDTGAWRISARTITTRVSFEGRQRVRSSH